MPQHQPETALALSLAQSRHILNSIPTVIYVLAVTGKGYTSQWVSDSVERILGYKAEEALAPDWWINCLHPDDRRSAVEKTSILMVTGHLVQEYRFRCKDGHYVWMQDEARLLREANGTPKEVVGFWTTISDRKRAEEQEAQARVLETEISELSRTNNRIALRLVVASLIVGAVFLLLAAKGPLMWGMTILALAIFTLGCALAAILTWLVVRSNIRSRHILNSIPTVIYVLATKAKGFASQWVSDSVKRILGYDVQEALNPDWWVNCLHPDDRAAAVDKTTILMSKGHLVQEYRFRCKDGRYLWIQDEARLLRRKDGRPKEIVGFWTDISDRKEAEERATAAREQETARLELTRSSDRNIGFGALIAALIVGSSFLLFNQWPLTWEMSIIGLAVFGAGCCLGLGLIWLVLRTGKY